MINPEEKQKFNKDISIHSEEEEEEESEEESDDGNYLGIPKANNSKSKAKSAVLPSEDQTENGDELILNKNEALKRLKAMPQMQELEEVMKEADSIELTRLDDGDSFGELALIEDKPRAATIKCLTNCTFATMSRTDYEKTLKAIENRNTNKVIDFFKSLPYFSGFGRYVLNKLRLQFKRIRFGPKHVVYKRGDPSEYVYIVISGDFELHQQAKVITRKGKFINTIIFITVLLTL